MIRAMATYALIAAASSGCVTYSQAEDPRGERFDLLYDRQLAAFEHRLAVELHTGGDDDWTQVGIAWIRFVGCSELDLADPALLDDPMARVVYASLLLEETRRRRLIRQHEQGFASGWTRTIVGAVHDPAFFDRSPDKVPEGYIQWPATSDIWADELPAFTKVTSECEALLAEPPEGTLRFWLERELEATDQLISALEALPESGELGLTGSPAVLRWRARLHGAQLSYATARQLERHAASGSDEPRHLPHALAARARARAYLKPLPGLGDNEAAEADLPPAAEHGSGQFLYAVLLADDGDITPAIAELAAAQARGLNISERWKARYLGLRLLSESGLWTQAAALGEWLPPKDHFVYSAYAYRAAMAARRVGNEDRFLAIAMDAFRDRVYEGDPFLQALYFEILQVLADYPFEERTIELLEDLGPRSGTLARVEELAAVALDRGRPENTSAAAYWLLAQQSSAAEHPRFYALLALAAFLENDEAAFQKHVARITNRPARLLQVIPDHRRPAFFAHSDAELARVLRLMLPVMAEWGEAPSAQARRQKWLRIVVAETQDFLRKTPDTLARPTLIGLYRLAGAMLKDHPRGYAEHVGATEPAPIVLGTVRVARRVLDEHEPVIEPSHMPIYSLTLIPRDLEPVATWPSRWSDASLEAAR